MSTPFRPFDDQAFSGAGPQQGLTQEHLRRLQYNGQAVINERACKVGCAWLEHNGAEAIRALWRAPGQWALLGPVHVYVPGAALGGRATVPVTLSFVADVSAGLSPGPADVWLYVVNPEVTPVTAEQMTEAALSGPGGTGDPWRALSGVGSYASDLVVQCRAGWQALWLAVRCVGDILSQDAFTFERLPVGGGMFPALRQGVMDAPGPVRVNLGAAVSLAGPVAASSPALVSAPSFRSNTGSSIGTDVWLHPSDTATAGLTTISVFPYGLPFMRLSALTVTLDPGLTPADAQYGASVRPWLPASGTQARFRGLGAESAHRARLPQVTCLQDLGQQVPETDPPVGQPPAGVPTYWATAPADADWHTVRQVTVSAHDLPLQPVLAGLARAVEGCVSLVLGQSVDPFIPNRRSFGLWVAVRLVVRVDGVDTSGPEAEVQLPVLDHAGTDTDLGPSIGAAAALTAPGTGCTWALEGLSTFRDIDLWHTVRLGAPLPAGGVKSCRLLLQVQSRLRPGVPFSVPGLVIVAGHLGARITEG